MVTIVGPSAHPWINTWEQSAIRSWWLHERMWCHTWFWRWHQRTSFEVWSRWCGRTATDTCYVDAQGAPPTVQSTRLANVQFGHMSTYVTWKCFACWMEHHYRWLRPFGEGWHEDFSHVQEHFFARSRSNFNGLSARAQWCSACSESCSARNGATLFDTWLDLYQSPPFCNQNCAPTACEHNFVSQRRAYVATDNTDFSRRLGLGSWWNCEAIAGIQHKFCFLIRWLRSSRWQTNGRWAFKILHAWRVKCQPCQF